MNELMEKIKGIDKRVLIGIGIACAAVIVLVIVLIAGGNDKPAGNGSTQGGTQMNSENSTEHQDESDSSGTEDETETKNETEIGTENENDTEIETEESEVIDTEKESENNDTNTGDNGTGNVSGGDNQDSNSNDSTEGEILGEGSKNQPFLEIPDGNLTVKTAEVSAGKTLYYSIQRIGGLILTINDANAYVITSNGTRYDAENGKVSLQIENALASEYVTLQIGNKGDSNASFTLEFSNAYGSRQNPETISQMGKFEKSLQEGNEVGHYYKYTAEQTGKLRFYFTATVDSEMTITNNSNSVTRTFDADGLTDEQGREYIELEVSKGDTIMIHVSAIPNKRGKYLATDITWEGIYQ